MFFKKNKTMNQPEMEQEQISTEQSDNLTAQEADNNEEILAQALNTDDSVPGTQHLDDAVDDEGELEKLKEDLAAMKDKYLRLVAEFDNFRRRTAKESLEMKQTAGKEIIQSLLVVLDDMDRAANQMEKTDDLQQIREGVSLVFNKLRSTLQAKGLKKMESKEQEFNADLHEAITEIPAPTPELAGKVIDEIEPGYYLNEKLIRFAKVVVGK
jgi:molecular chaperone GrpE